MSTTKYNKLVRDRIPEIIEKSGKQCACETLSDEEYVAMLDAKLSEELAEYQESKSMEELADLLEVIRAVAGARGSSIDEVEAIRREKAARRGSFDQKILLVEVRDARADPGKGSSATPDNRGDEDRFTELFCDPFDTDKGQDKKGGVFMNSVAVMGIIVEKLDSVEELNALLHDYGDSIIGRMGLPHRVKGINIISIALDAPEATIRELEAKLDGIDGVRASTAWSR